MQSLGLTVGTRVLGADILPATIEVAGALDIRAGDPVLRLRRLRLGNDMPIGIQTAHLPLQLVPGLEQEAFTVASLYETLKARYGIVPTKANEIYRVGIVSAEDAELIQLPAGTPAFVVERTTYSSRGAFEFTTSTMRADRYEIRSTLYV
jgi:GntR family transcriptional regulator